jgi:DNA repair protein SbcD/Mre11
VLDDEHGQVAVYGIPYLEPALALPRLPPEGEPEAGTRGHAAVLGAAVRLIRADAAARGAARTVVLAHAWVAGGRTDGERADSARQQASGSERDISVGGIGYVPAALFDGFSYVALGHLHGQQTLAEHLRYSGSPLPYSFSEKNHKKGSWLVEVGLDGKTRVERVAAPLYRRLAELTGRIDDLLTSAEHNGHEDDFVGVTLTDTARPEAAMDRLRRRFPHILTLEFKPDGVTRDQRSYRERVKGRDDLTVAAEFVRHVRSTEATQLERELLAEAFTAASDTANDTREGRR